MCLVLRNHVKSADGNNRHKDPCCIRFTVCFVNILVVSFVLWFSGHPGMKVSLEGNTTVIGMNPNLSQIAKFMGPTWGPPESCRLQMGPMFAP